MGKDTNPVIESKTFKVKVANTTVEGERTIVAVVSSENFDRDYDRVSVKTLRLPLVGGGYVSAEGLTGNEPIDIPLLINHSFDVEDVIGSVRKAYLNDIGELVFELGISGRAKAQDLMQLIDEEHLSNAFSITMSDFTYADSTILNAEIVEVSLVFRGSNKEARVLAVKSLVKGESEVLTEQSIAGKKAEIERLTKEVEVAESTSDSEAVEQETEVVEQKAEEQEAGSTEEVEEAEEAKEVEESKTVKKEEKMSKDIAIKQVKDVPEVEVVESVSKMDKIELTAKQFTAWVNKDHAELAKLNKIALDSYKTKATPLQTAATADGGALVPSAELLTDVFTTLTNYSTVAGDLRTITLTEGDSLDVATLVTDVIMTEVATEGGTKAVTKPVFGDGNVSLREFAGIAIMTKKLVRQAAVNVYDIVRESFARAIAEQRAIMALTDGDSGIVNKAGVVEVEASGATVDTYKFVDLKKMAYAIPAGAVPGSKYYISRELLETLDLEKDGQGRDLDNVILDGDGLSGRFKNGFSFAVEEVLGTNDTPHAVFGSMGRFGILLRQGTIEAETFDTGTVVDATPTTHNLLQQNKLAHRVAFYENVGYPLPGAFSVLVPQGS